MKAAWGMAVILGLTLVSRGSLLTDTINGISVDVTSAAPTSNLLAYTFHLSSAAGMYSCDGRVDAFGAARMNQNWVASATTPTPVADPLGLWGLLTPNEQRTDTCILVPSVNMIITRAASEHKVGLMGINGLNGTWLASSATQTMAFGFKDAPPSGDPVNDPDNYFPGSPLDLTSFDFAYVVVSNVYNTVTLTAPTGPDYVKFSFLFQDATSPTPNDGQFDIYLVPEPVTLSLLALGGLALLRRPK